MHRHPRDRYVRVTLLSNHIVYTHTMPVVVTNIEYSDGCLVPSIATRAHR